MESSSHPFSGVAGKGSKLGDLQSRPKDQKKVIAGGGAALVAFALFAGWAFFFFHKIINGQQVDTSWGPQKDIMQFTNVKEAQDSFSKSYNDASSELKAIRDDAAGSQTSGAVQSGETTYKLDGSAKSAAFEN